MAMRHGGNQALAAAATAAQPRHVRFGPGFIEEDQPFGSQVRLQFAPVSARLGNVCPGLLGGVQRLFLSVSPRRASVFHISPRLTGMWCVSLSHARNSFSVTSGCCRTCAAIASCNPAKTRWLCDRCGLGVRSPVSACRCRAFTT
jgi:hypothetical protein